MRVDPLTRLIGARVAGRYRVVSELSRGGMGIVFRAVQEPLEREIALKIMLPGPAADLTMRRRFIQEAQALSRTVHPNIVTIFDFGEVDDGSLFIAMELINGLNLRELLHAGGRVPWRDASQMVIGTVRALAAAHATGITHRDLKPDNIMLVGKRWRAEDVKLLDFGLARTLGGEEGLTQHNVIPGTPHYIAPERVSSKVDDPRSDLYALGAIWFEMLTGRLPFDGDTVAAILIAHVQKVAPRLSEVAPELEVPAEVERLIARLLAKQPADRWPDARELLSELEGRDLEAPAPTPGPQALRVPSRWTNSSASTVAPARFGKSLSQAGTPQPPSATGRPGAASAVSAPPSASTGARSTGAASAGAASATPRRMASSSPSVPSLRAAPTAVQPRGPASRPVTSPTDELRVGGELITVEHALDEGRNTLTCVAIFRGRLLRKVEVELPRSSAAKVDEWVAAARADFTAGLRALAASEAVVEPPDSATPPHGESAETRLFFFAIDSWLEGDRDTAIRTLESLRAALPEDARVANSYKALLLASSQG